MSSTTDRIHERADALRRAGIGAKATARAGLMSQAKYIAPIVVKLTHPKLKGTTSCPCFGTGNPTPAYTPGRGDELMDNLFTGSLIAVNVDTGKMAWYYQTAPHDMHDWDSTEDMVLVEPGGCRNLTRSPKMELLEV